MITLIKNAITRLLLPFAWARSAQRPAKVLKQFGDTESDSGWQYLQAMSHAQDPALRRMLFSNVLEEYRHADYFYAAAHQLAVQRLHAPTQPRTVLVNGAADLPGFLAYAHESEKSIHGQFDAYAAACALPPVAEAFRRISSDEEEHEAQALDFLRGQVNSPRAADWLVARAKLRRAYEAWMRGSQRVGDVMFGAVLSAVFFVFGPVVARRTWAARGTPARTASAAAPESRNVAGLAVTKS